MNMNANKELFAVVWQDMGLPLSLLCKSADKAIQTARDMRDKAAANKVTIHDLRAIRVPADSIKFETLWSA